MFEVTHTEKMDGRGRHYTLYDGVERVSYRSVMQLLQMSVEFRRWYTELLAGAPYEVFRWETPSVSLASVDQPFEFVLVDAPEIDLPANPMPFAEHFATEDDDVLSFPNLGGDALMVVPTPRGMQDAYAHLAVFLRDGPPGQVDDFWRAVGAAVDRQISPSQLWLNTAGGGVAWLHARLDSEPKYYCYAPYKSPLH